MSYPWLQPLWQQLDQHHADNRLHHALLIHSQANSGTEDFAQDYAKRLLCHAPIIDTATKLTQACQKCKSCGLFEAGSHPDFKLIELPEKKQIIGVAQIRTIENFASTSALSHTGKVLIVQPADAMNNAAMNALLKVLEEPQGSCRFILVTRSLHRLLPTVKSRCQQHCVAPPDRRVAIEWLQAQGVKQAADKLTKTNGFPLKVIDWQSEKIWATRQDIGHELNAVFDGVRTAKARPCWLKLQLDEVYALSQFWLLGMARSLLGADNSIENELPAWAPTKKHCLARQSSQLPHADRLHAWRSSQLLFRFHDKLARRRMQIQENPNLNAQVLADELILDWQALYRGLRA